MAESLIAQAKRDPRTVTPEGVSLDRLPDGVIVKDLVTHVDDRGSLCVMFDPREGVHPDPLVFTYFMTLRPNCVKGWNVHEIHTDRYVLLLGDMQVVLYDTRPGSPTEGLLAKLTMSEQRRRLVTIPPGVWHADWNVGTKDVVLVNHPTEPYDYERPDKLRLPLDTDLIPFEFPPGVRGY